MSLLYIQKKLAVILMLVIIVANTKAEEEYFTSLNPEGRTCECRFSKCLDKEIPTSPPPSVGFNSPCVGDPYYKYCCEV